ncbi:DNA replication complex GINS protein PSF3 [Liparis tanakae]|uniref:DNA replication complex GINS protein PSF3 n=1 Tax=Liparis tanakae TaxID=230148 RepID=A0A4Z2DYW6_9TELE|nr:DNA replication complex GINS protein PSF3 [Liparis tanakae]
MEENFLSLDDILLSHERLPVRTECRFPRLGYLERATDAPDIPEVRVSQRDLCSSRDNRIHPEISVYSSRETCIHPERHVFIQRDLYSNRETCIHPEIPVFIQI